jgi:hypothetical protein
MTRKGGMEGITYHSRKRKSLGISDFSVLASSTDWEAQVEWTFSQAKSTSWLLFISSFVLFPVPLLTGQTTKRLDYFPSLAFTQFILYFNFFSTPQINTLFCDPEIEKVGFLVPIPSARRFLLIIPMAGGYCVAPLIGAKGLDEQKPGFI